MVPPISAKEGIYLRIDCVLFSLSSVRSLPRYQPLPVLRLWHTMFSFCYSWSWVAFATCSSCFCFLSFSS